VVDEPSARNARGADAPVMNVVAATANEVAPP
jgi:hypothetical protein